MTTATMPDNDGRHLLRLIAGEDNKPMGAVCIRCRRVAWFDLDSEDCGESDADMTRRLGERCAGAPELTITLTHDDCNVLMHGLMPVDQILYTGDGETIPPFEDTPEMREFREHYVDLLERIIDVGVGRGDYDA